METLQKQEENSYNDELSYQYENWKIVTAHKKRKIIPDTSAMKISDTEKQQWLQDIPLRNSFSSLIEYVDTDPKEKVTSDIVKPPPIYIDDQIINPLIELLKNTDGKILQYKSIKIGTSKGTNKYSRNPWKSDASIKVVQRYMSRWTIGIGSNSYCCSLQCQRCFDLLGSRISQRRFDLLGSRISQRPLAALETLIRLRSWQCAPK